MAPKAESEFVKAAKRILDLSRQWQDARCWLSAFHHADLCREQESKGYAVANFYPFESKRHFEKATQARQVVDARHAELHELKNLLREHAPKLFGLISAEINFWNTPLADLSPWLNAMCQIESAFLAVMDETIARSDADEKTPPVQPGTPSSDVVDVAGIIQKLSVLFGESGGKMLRVISNSELSTDQKLREMERIDKPLMASIKSSVKLGEVLGVTGQAIRNTDWWIERRKKRTEE